MQTDAAIVLPVDTTTVQEAALMYVRAELPPVPVYGVELNGACRCQDSSCDKPGKHPVGVGWQKRASLDVDEVRERFARHRGNIGIYLGLAGLVLIDADGEEGLETARSWDLPSTLTQVSGSGVGAHYIYRLGGQHDSGAITDRRVAPGLDVKVRGQFVAAPSRHSSGKQYRITNAIPPAILSDVVYERIVKRRTEPPSATHPIAPPSDPSELYDRARKYVDKIDPALSGAGGHSQTFAVIRALAGWLQHGLPEADAWVLLTQYNARCQPPWSDHDLQHKWKELKGVQNPVRIEDRPRLRAIAGGRGARATDSEPPPPSSPPPGGSGREPDYRVELLWSPSKTGHDRLRQHVDNVVRILQLAPEWQGKIGFDAFRSRIVVASDAPWDHYQKPNQALSAWTDNDTTRLCAWMARKFHRYAFNPTIADCERAVAVVARTHDFNPVRDYLNSVAWDGIARLPSWLTSHLGADESEYSRLVGAWWLISAVARVFAPGCKVDTVPILEGDQGRGKSTALRTLAGPEFFNDTPIDLGSKDAYTAIQGCWFVELAELESLMRAEPSRSKAFFSSGKDRFRRAYARHETDELRQCIFVGTVNLGEYLNDPTGARRFWPIRCGRIDLGALERDRDQLWAEAVSEYQAGRPWYPTTTADEALFGDAQATRTKTDAWERKLEDYLRDPTIQRVTANDLLEKALKLEPRDWTIATQTRVGTLMISRLKWWKVRVTDDNRRTWVYERPMGG